MTLDRKHPLEGKKDRLVVSPDSISPNPDQPSARVRRVWELLGGIVDPEIPVISIVDLGIVAGVSEDPQGVSVAITPTFTACPATDVILRNVREALQAGGIGPVTVKTVFEPPWTSDRITPLGRTRLKEFGLAPPTSNRDPLVQLSILSQLDRVACPFCDSNDTTLDSPFGPTLCRSMHYCRACRQSFEHFKPVG